MGIRPIIAGCLLAVGTCAQARAAGVVLPITQTPPTLDGHVTPDEWRTAAGFDGFGFGDALGRRRARAFVTASETEIHVAIVSQLPTEGELLTTVDRDSLNAVHDDSVEVYVTPNPDSPDRVEYQLLVNSADFGGYNVHLLGNAKEDVAWKGNWRRAHGFHDGAWHFECTIPVASMVPGRTVTGGTWGINLTRNWKQPWEWASLSGGYANASLPFRFVRDPIPVVAYAASSDPFLTAFDGTITVTNPGPGAAPVKVSAVLTRNRMPEIRLDQTLSPPPGETASVILPVPRDDATTRFELIVEARLEADGTMLYSRTSAWPRGEPYAWIAKSPPPPLPVDFAFAYYPTRNSLRIDVDVSGLRNPEALREVKGFVRDRLSGEAIAAFDLPAETFTDGRRETRVDLPPLDGLYEIVLRAVGPGLADAVVSKPFERKHYPWEENPMGRSDTVYPPFTPIEADGNVLKTVLREHRLNGLGLWDGVKAASAQTGITGELLAAPMSFRVKTEAGEATPVPRPLKWEERKPNRAVTSGGFDADGLAAETRVTWDYDGSADVQLTLSAQTPVTVTELDLLIPLRADAAPMIHANSDRIRAPVAERLAPDPGLLWDASRLACDDFIPNFCPYVFLGSAVRGLCWFAENDRNWGWDPATPNLDVRREGDTILLTVHLVNRPTPVGDPRTLRFGLLAAPVKPRLSPAGPNGWRYRYFRDRYTLLGTDINWFSIGTCGSFYPAGGDLYLWQMLARGNRERLDDPTVEQVAARGMRYFEPYGPEAVESWVRHARYNLRSRFDSRMVFYYNRASHQGCEEFETFKDEWSLTDLRSVEKGNGIYEIKVVPSDSYVDFNLYWYARSFETGANRGVYWDNWFIAPSFNTEMTDAYRRPDGTVVPAAGMRRLRELARRTFIMMNELGMPPITFPHMTSFNPLPMMSFATVQYDWEWKYSLGDVQDRHTRELILLMSTGELAGVWPVPLSDHGNLAADPATQRTFAAVRLVHELDGSGGLGVPGTQALFDPVLKLLDEPDLRVARYWDEGPLPVRGAGGDVPFICYWIPGREALLAFTGYAPEPVDVRATPDLALLGLPPNIVAVNAEDGTPVPLEDGVIRFNLPKHDVRIFRLTPADGGNE